MDYNDIYKNYYEKNILDYLEKNQEFKISRRYPDVRISIAYSLFHMDLRNSLLGLDLHDFYKWVKDFDKNKYQNDVVAEFIKNEIVDIFQPDFWKLSRFSLTHSFSSIFMSFEEYLLRIATGMTADFIMLKEKELDVFLDYIFKRKFEINGYFDYFNKIFNLNLREGEFEGINNGSQWNNLSDFFKMRNAIIHMGGIKDKKSQVSMVKRIGEQDNKIPDTYDITKENIEELRNLTIFFADQIEIFFWKKMKSLGHKELAK